MDNGDALVRVTEVGPGAWGLYVRPLDSWPARWRWARFWAAEWLLHPVSAWQHIRYFATVTPLDGDGRAWVHRRWVREGGPLLPPQG